MKLFGGCDVLPVGNCIFAADGRPLNYEAALRVLEEEGFSVAALPAWEEIAGVHILFKTDTGEVLVKRLC